MPRFLVVDDKPSILDFVTSMLRIEGYEAVGVTSLVAARAEITRGRIDAVVTDLNLQPFRFTIPPTPPDREGLMVIACARETNPTIPIILMTGTGEDLAGEPGGGYTLLPKPFNMQKFDDALAGELATRPLMTRENVETRCES